MVYLDEKGEKIQKLIDVLMKNDIESNITIKIKNKIIYGVELHIAKNDIIGLHIHTDWARVDFISDVIMLIDNDNNTVTLSIQDNSNNIEINFENFNFVVEEKINEDLITISLYCA
ncbi:hypothetical protein SBFV3_gp50 [Sulfolobales Beppu filamentous virus 3]|uniref:Uncharacterized protein n=1 Tax=Sulfolobales Beppu filamentous virus 3 TaxID=2493124 RepID=A0A3Q8Q9Z8_9VIRU|nr:hypothetical protein HOU83_gp50 [Sulfolobales Beppu filamentous virus 3]AZI75885.1 hypothetical protein SBFV3_gp50 [Sulfolobales Beppu filamentous virus 3]